MDRNGQTPPPDGTKQNSPGRDQYNNGKDKVQTPVDETDPVSIVNSENSDQIHGTEKKTMKGETENDVASFPLADKAGLDEMISHAKAKVSSEPKQTTSSQPSLQKKSKYSLPIRPASPMELFSIKFPCAKCPTYSNHTEYTLTEFFAHQYSAHQTISCVYCDDEFEFAREIMVHLYREHRLKNQKFDNDDEFLRRGGGRATVICVECNVMLHMSPDSNKNIMSNHDCNKPLTYKVCQPAPEQKLDLLLLEPDPKKRIQLLIHELKENLLNDTQRKINQSEDPVYSILIKEDYASADSMLNQMIEKSSADCDYCRQVKLIRVDKRRLLLHLLRNHDWIVCSLRKKIKAEAKIEVSNGIEKMELDHEDAGGDANREEENLPFAKKSRVEYIDDSTIKNTEDRAEEIKSEQEELTEPKETPQKPPLFPFLAGIQVPDVEQDTDKVDVRLNEFYIDVLGKVFASEEPLVFSYHPTTKIEFGEIPCDCLICGFSATSQINLFPHWRKAHRGMSMKCPMCLGNFLFVGALFSHVCLGTPQHFVKTVSGGKVGCGGGVPDSSIAEGVVNGEGGLGTSNDTIALRYKCGICEDLLLPGFFNYMVHLRRDHNKCELCLETVANQKELEHHMKKHKLNHFCWKCSVTYVSKPNFMTHLFWKHGTESRECSVCLKKKWPHIYHFCIPPPWFTCDVCGLYFTKSKSLLVHKRLHSKEKLRTCSDCEQKFISASLLQKHMTSHAILPSEDLKLNESDSDESQDEDEPEVEELKPNEEKEIAPKSSETPADKIEEEKHIVNLETTSPKLDLSATATASPFEEKPAVSTSTDVKLNGYESDESQDEEEPDVGELKPKEEEIALKSSPTTEETVEEEKSNFDQEAASPRLDLSSTATTTLIEEKSLLPTGDTKLNGFESDESLSEEESDVREQTSKDETGMKLSTKAPEKMDEEKYFQPAGATPRLDLSSTATAMLFDEKFIPVATPRLDLSSTATSMLFDEKFIPAATPRLDLSSTATAMLFEEKAILEQPLSPLINPLEEFNISARKSSPFEETSLPDHISREKALASILMEHDYCLPMSDNKRKSGDLVYTGDGQHGVLRTPPFTPPVKRRKVPKKLPKPPHTSSTKMKRMRSSSSSSSSSSCSSCGSNCSCSSSSSSSSSSDSDSSDSSDSDTHKGKSKSGNAVSHRGDSVPTTVHIKPPPKKRGRKPKPKVDEPPKIKKPKGRPPKVKPRSKLLGFKFPTMESDLGSKQAEILKHFANPSDAFILEEDLDTTDSDSEDIFHKKQLSEPIIPIVPVFDEPWTAGNEKFLLKEVKGVKELEELRPKPQPLKLSSQKDVISPKHVPIKPIIVRRSLGNVDDLFTLNQKGPNISVMIGNTQITGKGINHTNQSSNSTSMTFSISRATPSSAPAIPSSGGIAKGTTAKKFPIPNIPVKSTTLSTVASSVTTGSGSTSKSSVNNSPAVSNANNVESQSPAPANAQASVPKVRRARMKITEVKSKPVVSSSSNPVPGPPPTEATATVAEADMNLYCICRGPHDIVSQMIGCDDDDCPYQWFHFECVGIVVAPKGKWYCSDCKERRRKKVVETRLKNVEAHGDPPARTPPIPNPIDKSPNPRGLTNKPFIGHTVS